MNTAAPASTVKSNDILITRIFDAPRELVFKAWTDPAHLMKWWSPKGSTTPHASVDLRVGGEFRFCMRFPDGREGWGKGIYREIVVPEKIVYRTHLTDAEGNVLKAPFGKTISGELPESIVTATFEDLSGKTKLTLHHTVTEFHPHRDQMYEGWTQMFDKLGNSF
jgi:uncharacterized protein YndB with AHSA1/START domain